jgi:Zn finger protein HypA/HybF involved in hydrogenase expression
MEETDLRLDGNAVAGALGEVFAYEMTTAVSTCANCGAVGELGVLHAYVQAPGAVVRCPRCGAVLMRLVRGEERLWLELRGVRSLEFRMEAG